MKVYLFDGSWDGLLTAIHEAYYQREAMAEIMVEGDFSQGLFAAPIVVETSWEKADRVGRAAAAKISRQALRHAYYAYLSNDPQRGTWIYRYLRFGFQEGADVDRHLTDERVLPVHRLSQKVRKECHLFLGLVRFGQLTGDIFYARIEPDHHIIALLAPHFVKRLGDQRWVIHDGKRGLAVFCDGREWLVGPLEDQGELPWAEGEEQCQELWKAFFRRIAITERINPRLQRQFIPRRYWSQLVEEPGAGR